MADQFVLTRIQQLPLFARLPKDALETVADAFQTVRYEPGMFVFRQGQLSQGLLLIAIGRGTFIRLSAQGNEEQIGQISPGEYINEAALFADSIESASLIVTETMVVLLLSRDRFSRLINQFPAIRAHLLTPSTGAPPVSAPPRAAPAPARIAAVPPTLPPRMPIAPAAPESAALPSVIPLAFEGQRDDETLIQVRRRHGWAITRYALFAVLIVLAFGVIAFAIAPASGLLAAALMGVGMVTAGVWIAYLYLEWKDDFLAITDQRVVRASNHLLKLENQLSEIPLDRVLEISVVLPPRDLFARLFNYGTVLIKTAGQSGSIRFDMTPDPASVQAAIFTQRDQFRRTRASSPGYVPVVDTPISGAELRTPRGFVFARTRFINEKGNLVYRKHASVWFAHIFMPTLIILLGIGIMIASQVINAWILRGTLGFIVGAVIAGAGAVAFYLGDWDWRSDLYILTKATVTVVRKRPLWVQNQVETIRLGQVENVVSDMDGLLNTVLRRGVVKIFMLGAHKDQAKILGPVYNPHELQGELSRRQQMIKSEQVTGTAAKPVHGYGNSYRVSKPDAPNVPAVTASPPAPRPPQSRDGIRPPKVPRARTGHELE